MSKLGGPQPGQGKTGVIGLTLTTLQDSVFDGIVKSVNEELEGHGYFLALSIHSDLNNDPPKENNFLFQEDRVDGIIALSPMDEEHDVLELKERRSRLYSWIIKTKTSMLPW
nr:hypothetical protein [Paenibacillus larvae]